MNLTDDDVFLDAVIVVIITLCLLCYLSGNVLLIYVGFMLPCGYSESLLYIIYLLIMVLYTTDYTGSPLNGLELQGKPRFLNRVKRN